MKKRNLLILILSLLVISIVGGTYVYSQKTYKSSVVSVKNIDKKLSKEETTKYENEIKKWDNKIKNFNAGTGVTTMGTGVNIEHIDNSKPNPDFFVEKARNQTYLGKYNDAINTLNDIFKYYENSSVAWNNLASIYEETGNYKEAIKNYEKIIFAFPDMKTYYYKKITNCYINLKDLKLAKDYYTKFEKSGGKRDVDLVNSIRKLGGFPVLSEEQILKNNK